MWTYNGAAIRIRNIRMVSVDYNLIQTIKGRQIRTEICKDYDDDDNDNIQ